MKHLKGWFTLLCCAVMAFFAPQAKAEESEQVESSARSAILMERETGKVLLAHNERERLPMASTTKVMTALMTLEYGRLDEVVTVGRYAYGVPGTSIYLNLGEKITLRDLLYGLMLASGNDAAMAIAEHIGGDVETFCRMMTERAAQLGCTDTVFLTPHGLPKDGHFTTAYDLALIAQEAMKHDLFREIVSTRRASIPWEGRSYQRILNNKNKLLSTYEGATGIKTGYTKAAGRCLVFGAKRDGLEVIGVVLRCSEWFDEAARLMDAAFERYEMFTAFEEGETVRVLPVEEGTQETVCILCGGRLAAAVPKGTVPVLEFDLPETALAGQEEGDVVGEVRLVHDGQTLAVAPLVLGETLAQRDYAYELDRVVRNWNVMPQSIAE
ncbi:MAG: D-alanyl-D-alanine carboxypeptidase [Clostridia bacterium]|nr:D-alanyl-D-alanine carboxypeptidase [Clostridia bacterium]